MRKARYKITNFPGVLVELLVEFSDGATQVLQTPGTWTVFQATQHAREGLLSRGADPILTQSWHNGCPVWTSEWVTL